MESLPDDVLHHILQIGIQAGRLDHVDLCSLAIVNNHFDQLTQDPTLWDTLLSHDFPLSFYPFEAPSKGLYRWMSQKVYVPDEIHELGNPKRELTQVADKLEREYQRPNKPFGSGITINNFFEGLNAIDNRCAGLVTLLDPLGFTIHEKDLAFLLLDEEWDSILPDASQPSLKQAHNFYYESKQHKRYGKSPRPKVNPNSKSYIPMNRPPRRSMPRKI